MPEQPHQFSKLAEELIGDLRHVPFAEPRRQVKRPTQPLGALVEEILTKHHIGRDSPEHAIRHQWAKLVGVANASYSHPVTIERGRLTVLVSHAVVRNELFMHKEAIVAKIRELPGCKDVKSLNLRTG
jgi:hypothetical protein